MAGRYLHRQVRVDQTGALLVCLLSMPGALVSALLTIVRFRSKYRCDLSFMNACASSGWFDCKSVLDSPWATLFHDKLPISIYSTAYYLVLFALGLSALSSQRLLPVVRPLILWMAWAGLAAVVCLGAYAYGVVGVGCSYCVIIYGITLSIFLAASLMNPLGHRAGLAALFVRTSARSGIVVLVALALVALSSAQMVQYLRLAQVDISDCTERSGILPESDIKTSVQSPEAEIAIFLDLACDFCKKEYESWRELVKLRPERFRLMVYHYARNGECMPNTYERIDRKSDDNDSCLAAQAVECAERHQTGAGLKMVDALFKLQGAPSPLFDELRVAEAAQAVGLSDVPKDSFDHPFWRCLRNKSTTAFIREHGRFGVEQRFLATPVVFFTFYRADGSPLPYMNFARGSKDYGNLERDLMNARAEALADDQERHR